MSYEGLETSRTQRTLTGSARLLLALHIDGPLFIALSLVGAVGVIVLFSASGQNLRVLEAQLLRFALATRGDDDARADPAAAHPNDDAMGVPASGCCC